LAVNKRKVLDAARKFAQKGAKERALKEYHVLLKLDPRDAKLHLEIGDVYRRWGQVEEAVSQYSRVADQYKADGFDARAVAVYKQILNLDSKRYSAQVSLSDLYQRMGLDAEAINALQAAADGYHKEGKKREALELLRKMATLDPTNTTSRLKVAELLQQEGMDDDAVSEYEAVAAELTRQSALESVTSVQERILEMQPDRADVLADLARNLIQLRQPERAEPYARRALAADSGDTDKYELMCDIHKSLGDDVALGEVTRELANLYRERGDIDRAREIAQRIPSTMEFDAEPDTDEPGLAEDEDDAPLLDDGLLDEEFLATDTTETTDPPADDVGIGRESDTEIFPGPPDAVAADAAEEGAAAPVSESAAAEPLPEGDPDQLMAEASVYLRYGKRDQARASLQGILAREPDHRAALEKLGEVYAEEGEAERAVEIWIRAAARAREEGDDAGLGILRDRIAVLDPAAAEALVEPAVEPEAAAEETIEETEETEETIDAGLAGIEIDLDGGFDADFEAEVASELGGEAAGVAGTDTAEMTAGIELDLDGDLDVEMADDAGGDSSQGPEWDDTPVVSAEAPDGAASGADQSGTAGAQQVAEDLEEAEFYYQQELYDEAEPIYRRVLSAVPNHPSALLRLGELAAARGEDPAVDGADPTADGAVSSADSETTALDAEREEGTQPELAVDVEVAGGGGVDLEIELPSDEAAEDVDRDVAPATEDFSLMEEESEPEFEIDTESSEADSVVSEPTAAEEIDRDAAPTTEDLSLVEEEPEPELDVAAESSEADSLVSEAPAAEDDEQDVAQTAEDSSAVDEGSEPEPEIDTESSAVESAAPDDSRDLEEGDATAGDDGFDLVAELRDVLAEDDESESGANGEATVLSTVEDGFASIFSEFKQGVSETLSEEDYETRYDLGIAYREMELYEDAVGEFRMCLDSEARRLDSLHMMGLCALDTGRYRDAVNHMEQVLTAPELPSEMRAGLQFDLGRAFQALGDLARARSAYESVREADASFPGIDEKLAELEPADAGGPSEAETEAGLESFDDLIAAAEAETESNPEEAEVFESFDDVITDVESMAVDPPSADAPAPLEETPPEPEPRAEPSSPAGKRPDPNADSASQSNPRSRRKKKISFV